MKKLLITPEQQQGFTFIESLMALFILSFGLLGVAGMHARSMQTGYVATQRMAAVSKGEELIERIRSNPRGIASYSGGPASNDCTIGDGSVICTPAEMAADDLFIWRQEVNATFPSPTVSIQVVTIDPVLDPAQVLRSVTVSIDWEVRDVAYNYTTVAEVGP